MLNNHQQQSHAFNSQSKQKQYREQLSKSFRDILENTFLINGMYQPSIHQQNSTKNSNSTNYLNNLYEQNRNLSMNLNDHSSQMTSINMQNNVPDKGIDSALNKPDSFAQNYASSVRTLNKVSSPSISVVASPTTSSSIVSTSQIPTTPVLVNNELAIKFAQLEHTLALTKAENNTLMEQQVNNFKYLIKNKFF